MVHPVAIGAEGNKICFFIVTKPRSLMEVVELEVGSRSAALASPVVTGEHLLPELLIIVRIELQPRTLWLEPDHAVARFSSLAKYSFCSPGKNLNRRQTERSRTSGSPFSRFAPARKSAQIISRQ